MTAARKEKDGQATEESEIASTHWNNAAKNGTFEKRELSKAED